MDFTALTGTIFNFPVKSEPIYTISPIEQVTGPIFTLEEAKKISSGSQTTSTVLQTAAQKSDLPVLEQKPTTPAIEISKSTGEVTVNTPKVEAAKKNYIGPLIAMIGVGMVILKDK